MALLPISQLSQLEKKLLRSYTVGGGSPTGGFSLSIYIRDFPDIHPNDLRNGLRSLVSHGYLTTKAGHGDDSFFFTEDGVFEAKRYFKNQIPNAVPKIKENWQNKILVYVAVGVIVVVLGSFCIYLIKKHLGISL